MGECETGEMLVSGVCLPKLFVGRLNPYWNKQLRAFAVDYKHPFNDIEAIIINTRTGQVSVVEREIPE